jgi:predicted dehydrogenase
MWQRSTPNFRRGVELVRNGMLGKILKVEVGTGPNKQVMPPAPQPGEKAPAEVDYDLWVGPSADFAYDPRVFHFHWRWHTNFGGGMLLDWVCHHPDIAAWAMGKDAEYPVSVVGTGKLREAPWDTHAEYDYTVGYADGFQMSVSSSFMGMRFHGEKGELFVTRGKQECSIPGLWEKDLGPDALALPRHDRPLPGIRRLRAVAPPPDLPRHGRAPHDHHRPPRQRRGLHRPQAPLRRAPRASSSMTPARPPCSRANCASLGHWRRSERGVERREGHVGKGTR